MNYQTDQESCSRQRRMAGSHLTNSGLSILQFSFKKIKKFLRLVYPASLIVGIVLTGAMPALPYEPKAEDLKTDTSNFNNNLGSEDNTLQKVADKFDDYSVVGVGEANTASNVGTLGTGLFKQKTGVDLQFYKVNSANNILEVSIVGTDYLQLIIQESNISHDNISGVSSSDHHIKTVDTSAETECSGDNVLQGDGSCVDVTTEIDSAISTHTGIAEAHQALVSIAGEDYLLLSDQAITVLKINDDNVNWGTGSGQVYTKNFIDYAVSPMVVSGGDISVGTNAGTYKVGSLVAILRSTDSETGALKYVTLAEQDNQTITAADTTYVIALNYNGGSPTISLGTTDPYLADKRNISIGKVMKNGGDDVHYVSGGYRLQDGVRKSHRRAKVLRNFELDGGSAIAYSGTNNFTMTTGIVFGGNNEYSLVSYDSAATQFTPVYQDGGAGWTEGALSNTIDYLHYDDGDGTLGNVGVAKYGNFWVYKHVYDDHVYVLYGRGNYSLAEAVAVGEPTKPDHLTDFGLLIGKIIAPQAGGSFSVVQMVTDVFFSGTSVSDHPALGNLPWTSSGHTGAASNFAGFDGGGAATEYPEADYFLADGTRSLTGNIILENGEIVDNSTDGKVCLRGGGGTNNEDVCFDLETTVNNVNLFSNTGVSSFNLPDNFTLKFGAGFDFPMGWTTTGNDNFQIGTVVGSSDASGYTTFMEKADMNHANRSPSGTSANPVVRVYSSDETQADDYIEMYHDQNDGHLFVGSGALELNIAGNIAVLKPTATNIISFELKEDGGTALFRLRGQGDQDQIIFAVSDAGGNQIVVTNYTNQSADADHAPQTNPTMFIQSDLSPDVSNNQWGGFAHDQENFVISTGVNTGAGSAPTTDENAIVFAPRGSETARVDTTGIVADAVTSTGTVEAATLTEGGNDVYNSTETPGGELGGTFASFIIDDNVTVTGWEMGASTATTPAENDNDTSLATTEYVQGEIEADTNAFKLYSWAASDLLPLKPLAATFDAIAPMSKDTGTNLEVFSVSFDDGTNECRGVNFKVSSDVDTSGTATFYATWYSKTATANDAIWYFVHKAIGEGESWDQATTAEIAAADTTQDAVDEITETTWTETLSNLGWTADEDVEGYICRDGAGDSGTDNLVGDSELIIFAIEVPRS
ncbi:hypothetical protein KAR91_11205 [Candidatus Pacearchaeota archaeon]|nr:hypothetical protein [Candidatus Pacearchaeota archaeon]